MLPRFLQTWQTALYETFNVGKSVLGDPARRADLVHAGRLGGEMLRGGLLTETEHPLNAGVLRLRTLLQLDGDLCTTVVWRATGSAAHWPSPHETEAALTDHRKAVDVGVRPLRDLASLTTAGIGLIVSLLALLPPLEAVVTGSENWLRLAGAAAIGLLILMAGSWAFRHLAAYLFRLWSHRWIPKLDREGDEQRSSAQTR